MIIQNQHFIVKQRAWIVVTLLLQFLMARVAGAESPIDDLPSEINVNGVEFVLIPGGWFYKSGGIPQDPGYDRLRDEFGGGNVKVWQDSFYMAKYEGRARDLVVFLNSDAGRAIEYDGGERNCSVRQTAEGQYREHQPEKRLPATHLSWIQANAWAEWMGFRLPTEAEWERAARGSDKRYYPWGNEYPDDTYAGFFTNSICFTWPVDTFDKGVSPYGVYNMAGNVREFVADWYDHSYDQSLTEGARNPFPADGKSSDPNGPSDVDRGPWKILKGGRWGSTERQLRVGARIYYLVDDNFRCNGTRFALDVETVKRHLANGEALITQR